MTEAQKYLHHIAENMRMDKSISKEGCEYFQQAIKALEQPIRKVSKWVPIWDKDHIVIYTYQCPECGIMMNVNTSHYCPGCGAKMESDG